MSDNAGGAHSTPEPRVPSNEHWVEPTPEPNRWEGAVQEMPDLERSPEDETPRVVDDGDPEPDHGCVGCHTDGQSEFRGLMHIVEVWRAMPAGVRAALPALSAELGRILKQADHYISHIENDDWGTHLNPRGVIPPTPAQPEGGS